MLTVVLLSISLIALIALTMQIGEELREAKKKKMLRIDIICLSSEVLFCLFATIFVSYELYQAVYHSH